MRPSNADFGLVEQLLDHRSRYTLLIGDAHRPAELACRDPDRIGQQPFGVLAIAPGHPAANCRKDRQHDHRGADALPDAGAPAGGDQLALAQVVERHAEHARDQFQLGIVLAVGFGAKVGGDRLGRLVGEAASRVDFEAQRRREALVFRRFGVRLAVDDQRQDSVSPAQPLELDDLLVDIAAPRRGRAAQHDQVARLSQRLAQHRGQIGRRGELVAVAEHREDFWRDRTVARGAADQRLGYAITFDRLVQPLRPALVSVAVADEYRILAPGGNDTRRVHARLRRDDDLSRTLPPLRLCNKRRKTFKREVLRPFSLGR